MICKLGFASIATLLKPQYAADHVNALEFKAGITVYAREIGTSTNHEKTGIAVLLTAATASVYTDEMADHDVFERYVRVLCP